MSTKALVVKLHSVPAVPFNLGLGLIYLVENSLEYFTHFAWTEFFGSYRGNHEKSGNLAV